MFWTSSLPIRGIRSCGIEALSNIVTHLKQLHMLALWGRLWNGLVLAMAENHIKTNSIMGLQLQAECWYEQEELPQA